MRLVRVWLSLGLLVLFVCQTFVVVLHAAVAHVQTISAAASGAALTLTSGSLTVTGGSLLIAPVAYYDTTTLSSVMLDGVTAFTQDLAAVNAGDTSTRGYLYSLPNVAAGAHTVTVTWASNTTYRTLFVMEVSGAATMAPLDGDGASAPGNSAACSSGPYDATGTSFWIGFAVVPASSTFTAGAGGWVIPTNGTNTVAGSHAAVEYKANPGSSPQTADWSNTSGTWECLGAAYLVASGGGGGAHHRRPLFGEGR